MTEIRNSDLKKGRVLERKEMKVKFHIPEVKHTVPMSCNFRLSTVADGGRKGGLMTQKLLGEGYHLLKAEGRRKPPRV